jgi:hypothetical protein
MPPVHIPSNSPLGQLLWLGTSIEQDLPLCAQRLVVPQRCCGAAPGVAWVLSTPPLGFPCTSFHNVCWPWPAPRWSSYTPSPLLR